MATTDTDVVIVGAGAAGSVFAAILAEAGHRVLVLETGPARTLDDLYSSQIWARRLKWAAPHVPDAGKDSIWHNMNAGRGFGGAAVHHYAVWPRMHEDDFRVRSEFGRGRDWPLEYTDLRPFYDQVQKDVGMSGDAEAEVWRPPGDPYPLPPVPAFPHGQKLAEGFEAMGMTAAPLPLAILSRPYNGRAACIWDGWCDAGCPIGALANPLVVYGPRALAAGARFQADSHVSRVLSDPATGRATGVEYFDAAGQRQEIRAKAVVLAAFAVENVRLLLNSAGGRHPDGLANGSGLVGRCIMSHHALSVFGLFDEDLQNHMGATGGQFLNQDGWQKDGDEGAFGSRQWAIAQALKPNDLLGIAMSRADLFHADLTRFMERAVRGMAAMTAITEDQPLEENRIELDSARDRFGVPQVRANYAASPDGLAQWRLAVSEGTAVMKAAGAKEVWNGPKGGQHVMGGTIMGMDARSSVANSHGQAHEVDNLFFGGAGLFPTSSAVGPTFTLHALALKSARWLADNWAGVTR